MLYNLFENRDFVSVFAVALLAEGVDRNVPNRLLWEHWKEVALLAEGVDRNPKITGTIPEVATSPSSRRAWIEIYSVDNIDQDYVSPSSRRAWIEIPVLASCCREARASPSSRRAWIEIEAPSTDVRQNASPSSRRAWIEIIISVDNRRKTERRPPRGGRG